MRNRDHAQGSTREGGIASAAARRDERAVGGSRGVCNDMEFGEWANRLGRRRRPGFDRWTVILR